MNGLIIKFDGEALGVALGERESGVKVGTQKGSDVCVFVPDSMKYAPIFSSEFSNATRGDGRLVFTDPRNLSAQIERIVEICRAGNRGYVPQALDGFRVSDSKDQWMYRVSAPKSAKKTLEKIASAIDGNEFLLRYERAAEIERIMSDDERQRDRIAAAPKEIPAYPGLKIRNNGNVTEIVAENVSPEVWNLLNKIRGVKREGKVFTVSKSAFVNVAYAIKDLVDRIDPTTIRGTPEFERANENWRQSWKAFLKNPKYREIQILLNAAKIQISEGVENSVGVRMPYFATTRKELSKSGAVKFVEMEKRWYVQRPDPDVFFETLTNYARAEIIYKFLEHHGKPADLDEYLASFKPGKSRDPFRSKWDPNNSKWIDGAHADELSATTDFVVEKPKI
jgi:hypothetical protein